MIYELAITSRTLRYEGLSSFLKKAVRYFCYIFLACYFMVTKRTVKTPQKLVSFVFRKARGIIAPIQIQSELTQLATLIKTRRPKTVLEIGTFRGGTLFLFCALSHPKATIATIDFSGAKEGGYAFWRRFFYQTFVTPQQTLYLLWADSHKPQTVSKVKSIFENGLDLLFIDGDHSYKGVRDDFENYSPLVSKKGLIIFHDICHHPRKLNCHVDMFWNKVKKGKRYLELIEDSKQGWGGIGIIVKS